MGHPANDADHRRASFVVIRAKLWCVLGLVALLPVVNLWTIDELDRRHRTGPDLPTQSIADTFALDNAVVSRMLPSRFTGIATDAGTGPGVGAAAIVVPAAQALTMPPSHWHTPVVIVAFASSAVVLGLVMALVLSVARGVGGPAAAVPASPTESPPGDVHRLAEQLREDTAETVHGMRTPLAVIMGSVNALKRTISPEDARAWRAIESVDVAAARLVGLVDDSWRKGDGLSRLFLARRRPVDLAEVVKDLDLPGFVLEEEGSNRFLVSAPEGVLEEVIEDILSSFETGSRGRIAQDGDEVSLRIGFGDREPAAGFVQANGEGFEQWPALSDAARTVTLLGGRMMVAGTSGRVDELLVTLPTPSPSLSPSRGRGV